MTTKLMCAPVSTTPPWHVIPGSTQMEAGCGHEVYLAPSGAAAMEQYSDMVTICTACVKPEDLLEAVMNGRMQEVAGQREEIAQMGEGDAEALERILKALRFRPPEEK